MLKLDLGRKFDWIAIFFNTLLAFTTLEELDRVLQNVRKHLKPSGRFWLDIFNPDHSMLSRERNDGPRSLRLFRSRAWSDGLSQDRDSPG